MSSKEKWIRGAAIVLVATPALAWAHVGSGEGAATDFWTGAGHPLSGLDHLLTMVAAGVWAAQSGGRSVWAVPVAFVTLMLAGGAAGLAGLSLPYVEQGIVASLLVLGLLIASACRMSVLAGMAIAGFFAIFHGYAHGAEMPLASGTLAYSTGFALATALLHGLGIGGAISSASG